jgi:hypothetical protein
MQKKRSDLKGWMLYEGTYIFAWYSWQERTWCTAHVMLLVRAWFSRQGWMLHARNVRICMVFTARRNTMHCYECSPTCWPVADGSFDRSKANKLLASSPPQRMYTAAESSFFKWNTAAKSLFFSRTQQQNRSAQTDRRKADKWNRSSPNKETLSETVHGSARALPSSFRLKALVVGLGPLIPPFAISFVRVTRGSLLSLKQKRVC